MSLLFLGSPVVLFGILAFVSGQEQQLLMVFGGRGCEAIQGCPYANNVTLISLDGGPSVPDCLNNLGPPPKRLYSACQATLGEGKLRVNFVQPADIGWPTGNGEKLSCCQAQLSQATCLAVAYPLSISCRPSYVRRL